MNRSSIVLTKHHRQIETATVHICFAIYWFGWQFFCQTFWFWKLLLLFLVFFPPHFLYTYIYIYNEVVYWQLYVYYTHRNLGSLFLFWFYFVALAHSFSYNNSLFWFPSNTLAWLNVVVFYARKSNLFMWDYSDYVIVDIELIPFQISDIGD